MAQNILEYHVTLEADLDRAWVTGQETIVFDPRSIHGGALVFTANSLQIIGAVIDGREVEVVTIDEEMRIPFVRQTTDERARLDISFRGTPSRGYDVSDGTIVTSYFACDWMVCAQESFGDKATVSLDLIFPQPVSTVGPGELVKVGSTDSGGFHALWQEDRPYSPYLFAFAAGDFAAARLEEDDVELRFLSTVATPEELERLFAPTADMLAFFEAKAQTPFPHAAYTQVLVEGGAAQEAVSHAIIGRQRIGPILGDPSEDWVIAHELAHQWWGNAITCNELSEFWLNEGVTVFMVAAWKEYRWGEEAYARELELARRRLSAARAAGFDVPLTYSGEYPSLAVRRAVQYSKGALFLDALRREVGDRAFWSGIAQYTRSNMGGTVTSRDFQRAMEEASRQNLSAIFDSWVYEPAPPPIGTDR